MAFDVIGVSGGRAYDQFMKIARPSWLILCLAAFVLAGPVWAQEATEKAPPMAPAGPEAPPIAAPPPPAKAVPLDIPMEAFGTANPDCLEWTDSCQICLRDAENKIACSTPGIACLPEDIACKTPRKK